MLYKAAELKRIAGFNASIKIRLSKKIYEADDSAPKVVG
jgi:hypothetical protein